MEYPLLSKEGKNLRNIELNPQIFDGKVNLGLLTQAVYCYLNNLHSIRKASTKTRAEVKGSGAKPWRQKGTGRARVGEIRNPLWRKGGVVFGPKPRYVYKNIPKKMKAQALKSALNAKFKDKELFILEDLKVNSKKTKDFLKIIKALNLNKRSLFVDENFSPKILLSVKNLKNIELVRAKDLNAYQVLNYKNLILTL
ncbi:MAG: 50S ribosomal protein L4, partial [Candidatus Omnitrophota bacterium]